MALPGRTVSSSTYRYGFNGKERDKDIAGDNYDFGARIYDGRIGRWLSTDPYEIKYPAHSPYNFAGNNPVFYIDQAGKFIIPYEKGTPQYKAAITMINYMKAEVNTWTDTDPKWQAFQALTGTSNRSDLLNVLEDGNGPLFLWGEGKTTNGDGSFLMRSDGTGFVPGSAYALTKGTESITFDEGLMSIVEGINRIESTLNEGRNSYRLITNGNSENLEGNDAINTQLEKAKRFLVAIGIHELTHEEYNKNGSNASLNQPDANWVDIENTDTNRSLFSSILNGTPQGGCVTSERGDAIENAMYGQTYQWNNSGILPYIEYNRRRINCNMPNQDRGCVWGEIRNKAKEDAISTEKEFINNELGHH